MDQLNTNTQKEHYISETSALKTEIDDRELILIE